jgi:hypothetical protein
VHLGCHIWHRWLDSVQIVHRFQSPLSLRLILLGTWNFFFNFFSLKSINGSSDRCMRTMRKSRNIRHFVTKKNANIYKKIITEQQRIN